ncbi:MAG: rhomboid family intramembrane serine protease [Nitrospinae bacterium RIFCSPLOWO2_12_39_16]|nr:MAG: rhomboid family intramembrane serine protease [Nitrospinae bacterium RIFCSPLOWO2_02_39_17]OGW12759.1 MAG: rhomboid family intramembrane serine protease [Nitrospinae bacterium RIFCSPLOWO2_12_39_16]
MIPLKDDNPTKIFPIVTIGIIAANILVFIYQLSLGAGYEKFIFTYGAFPYEITHSVDIGPPVQMPVFFTVYSSMFMHGGFMHIIGNMLYLWIFGNNIEDSMGHIRFIFFYLICGTVASLTHIFLAPNSKIPMVGASGAVSGILGAYLLLFPHARILTLVTFGFFIKMIKIPAMVVLGFWIVLQFLNSTVASGSEGGGVAWFAHIGGFFAGLILINFFKKN